MVYYFPCLAKLCLRPGKYNHRKLTFLVEAMENPAQVRCKYFTPSSQCMTVLTKLSPAKCTLPCRELASTQTAVCNRLRHGVVQMSSTRRPDVSANSPATAKDAVTLGLSLFSKGKVKDALEQFDAALKMDPAPEEAQAALYNKACCHAYRGEGESASQALRQALGQYDLKFSVILNDPDLASFRAMPEFKKLQNEARTGGQDVGGTFRRDLKLISEVQAPFRVVRKVFYVAITISAGISTLFTIPRLVLALQGSDGAPNLLETSQNLAINLGGIVISVALFKWESKKQEEQMANISRNETLSRLPLKLSTGRVVELVQLRETSRPVVVAGRKETVAKAVQQADKFRDDLVKRGVVVIPLVWNSENNERMKRKGFGTIQKSQQGSVSSWDDFERRAGEVAAKGVIQAERRFKAEIVSLNEWESWVRDQQETEGIVPGQDVFIVLRLDGRIRKSGQGMPDWEALINELPPLDAFMSQLEK